MTDYTIEQLEKTFKEHSEKFEFQKTLTHGRPEHYPKDFNISEALHVICSEINQINRAIDRLEKGVILPEKWGKLRD